MMRMNLPKKSTSVRDAFRKQLHVVGGFDIMDGIVAIILGHLIRAQSMYFCVGSPPEMRDIGIGRNPGIPTPSSELRNRYLRPSP